MVKNLQNVSFKNIDTQKRAKVEMKRGAFVKANEATGELELATATADVTGFVVRDVIVTDKVAMGIPVSDWDIEQDTIKQGEFAGLNVPFKGERFATDQYTVTNDADVAAGLTLDVANGKLIKAVTSSTSKIVSLGFMDVAGHKMLGYKFV